MERFTLIDNVYTKLTDVFLENIQVEKKETTRDAYLAYLHRTYDLYFKKCAENELDSVATMCVKKEKIVNLKKSVEEKLAFLFPDDFYIQLENISFELAEIAAKKKDGKEYNIEKSKEAYLDQMKMLYDKVSEAFRYSADRVYSEGILDLEYLFGEEDKRSFRNAT